MSLKQAHTSSLADKGLLCPLSVRLAGADWGRFLLITTDIGRLLSLSWRLEISVTTETTNISCPQLLQPKWLSCSNVFKTLWDKTHHNYSNVIFCNQDITYDFILSWLRFVFISIVFTFLLVYFFTNATNAANELPFWDNNVLLYCTVLYCTVLYCTVLYCTVLYSITALACHTSWFWFLKKYLLL